MKKRVFLPMAVLLISGVLTACGQKEAPSAEAETQKEAAAQAETEAMTGMANPWRDITYEEAYETVSKLFKAPEGAENVKWRICESEGGENGLPGPIVEMDFTLDGLDYTAREQVTGDVPEDISGLYFDWTVTDDITLGGWGDGAMAGKYMRYIGEDECTDLITWYDLEYGASYSLGVSAEDLEGFDLQAIAEAIYDPSTQPGANVPDDEEEEELSVYEQDLLKYEDTILSAPEDAYYAFANLDKDYDALIIAPKEEVFDNGEGGEAATGGTVYCIGADGNVKEFGTVESGGAATPLAVGNLYVLYNGNHSYINKMTLIRETGELKTEQGDFFDEYEEAVPITFLPVASYGNE